MLTVLIRYKSGDRAGREVITPATSVEFVPNRTDIRGTKEEPGLLINLPEGAGINAQHLSPSEEGSDDWRDVFVMNAQGQTVARYIL